MTASEKVFDPPPLATIVDQIAIHLERLILEGKLRNGQRLSEPEIAKQFGTSRSPVREALRKLADASLVKIEPRRGATVTAPTPRDIANMLVVREALEGMTARLAAERADAEDIDRMKASLEFSANVEDLSAVRPFDFHECLMAAAKNKALQEMLNSTLNMFRVVWKKTADRVSPSQVNIEHSAIFAAINARDPDAAEAAARAHIRTTGTYFSEEPAFMARPKK